MYCVKQLLQNDTNNTIAYVENVIAIRNFQAISLRKIVYHNCLIK